MLLRAKKMHKISLINGQSFHYQGLLKHCTCLDFFERGHSDLKGIRMAKRTSVNPLFTMISEHEHLSVYNTTSELIPSPIDTTIIKVSEDTHVLDYTKKVKVAGGIIYECSKVEVFGTPYNKEQFIILPSTNDSLVFGQIVKLLSSTDSVYFLYQKTHSVYCPKKDLYMVENLPAFSVIPSQHLADYRPLEA